MWELLENSLFDVYTFHKQPLCPQVSQRFSKGGIAAKPIIIIGFAAITP